MHPNQNEFQKPSYGNPSTAATGIPMAPYATFNQPPSHFQTTSTTGTPGYWSTGLFDCTSDVHNCCITCWCPCITFGQIADIVDKGDTPCAKSGGLYALISLLSGFGCMYSCLYRNKMRQQYNLPEQPCGDCLVHFCCETCSLCQEYRELKDRGFDMSIGWHGNMQKQNGGITMAPPSGGGMSRY
ncbi:hypothetical protein M9H77_08756 [Catharanthus roseus]|uniref:Uncharacterized protein n=1 Tax=Catharanthus roseus TaxID=4058 RepID=A0ACC0BYP5_CATRO|nr:hypothetical protein M9H77_08756 [Catharanthus roseus]